MEHLSRKLLTLARTGWLVVGGALIFLLLLELAAPISLRVLAPRGDFDLPPGAPAIWHEQGSSRQIWRPYVYWRTEARSGPVMNIDADGIRRTWRAPGSGRPSFRVFMFGASTLRGYHVRDDFTIPSFVAKILARDLAAPVEVANFGQLGYVSTQDVIALALEVRRGNVPDVAIFYNGTVDIESTHDGNAPGSPRWEYQRRNAFHDFERALALRIARRSSLAQLVLNYVPGWSWALGDVGSPRESPAVTERLARETLEVYAGNLRLADALAREYGFDVLYFWQPVVWSRDEMTAYEAAVAKVDAHREPGRAELFREVYRQAAVHPELAAHPRFFDLRDAADAADEPPFWDPTHTTEAGNEWIAEKIAVPLRSVIERRLGEQRPAPSVSR
ncbi:MAG: SGNH/GDSL hydrolase family protein [Myxococcales bacterium]|nr:SGNH/GDSL hydrolase family protein [Myxococcales bacterium]